MHPYVINALYCKVRLLRLFLQIWSQFAADFTFIDKLAFLTENKLIAAIVSPLSDKFKTISPVIN